MANGVLGCQAGRGGAQCGVFFLVLSDCESIDAFRAFGSPGLAGGGGSLFVWSAANSVATNPLTRSTTVLCDSFAIATEATTVVLVVLPRQVPSSSCESILSSE